MPDTDTDTDTDDARARIQRVARLFEEVPMWANEDAIPHDSLLREFIGGSTYHYA